MITLVRCKGARLCYYIYRLDILQIIVARRPSSLYPFYLLYILLDLKIYIIYNFKASTYPYI